MSLNPKRMNSAKHLKYLIKDEKMATKEYADMAKFADNKHDAQILKEMSRDEERHKEHLEAMLEKKKMKAKKK